MRVLVTGAAGQVGREIVATCEAAHDQVTACARSVLDVTDRDSVLGAISTVRPALVVHAAAWTAVDACESDPAKAFQHNALAVRWIADACRRFGAHLVHLSTDYVFSGNLDRPYVEWDATDPRSVYGRSKRAGELEALAWGSTVVRTSWICGAHGSNVVKTILRIAQERTDLAFVDDQRGHPTFASDLAPMVRRLGVDRLPGIVHVTNAGPVSWFEFAQAVMAAAGHDPARVRPVGTADLDPPRPAFRPANSVLANEVLRLAGYRLLDDFRAPLGRLVAELTG